MISTKIAYKRLQSLRQHFFQKDHVTEYLDRSGIDRFDETDFGNDDKAANLAVSDHRPVWAVFSITQDDDDGDRATADDDEDESASELEPLSESVNRLDVNGDGVINILDLVSVAMDLAKPNLTSMAMVLSAYWILCLSRKNLGLKWQIRDCAIFSENYY